MMGKESYNVPLTILQQYEVLEELSAANSVIRMLQQKVTRLENGRAELTKMIQELMSNGADAGSRSKKGRTQSENDLGVGKR